MVRLTHQPPAPEARALPSKVLSVPVRAKAMLANPVEAAEGSQPETLVGFETEAKAHAEDLRRMKGLRDVISNPAGGWLNIRHAIWSAAQRLQRSEHPPLDYDAGRALIAKLQSGVTSPFASPTLAS